MPGVAAALTAPGAGVDIATGVVVAAAGVAWVARRRRPLLLVVAVAWLAGDVWSPLVHAHRGPLAQLALGWSPLTAVAYVDGLVSPLARSPWVTLALCAAVVGTALWRRRALRAAGALLVAGALACEAIGKLTGADTAALAAWWYDVAVAAAAVAVAFGDLPRPAASVAANLVIDLGAEPRALRDALARAVGDPSLQVAYRVGEVWIDEAGRAIELRARDGRVVRVIDDVAALVHDPAALHDDALARSVDAAVRLALANVRLQADVAARVREVELSRRRLVEAGDAERRRLREQLRAGAERHLAAAGAALDAVPGAAALSTELDAAHADLVRFAQGIHPRALSEHGLAGALRELAELSPVPVTLAITEARFPGPHETVAYFICSEALTNVGKYAPDANVQIAASADTHLRLRITDDGRGGADPARGSGLRGLADRAEALGGRLTVESRPGAGTLLHAVLPLRAPVESRSGPSLPSTELVAS